MSLIIINRKLTTLCGIKNSLKLTGARLDAKKMIEKSKSYKISTFPAEPFCDVIQTEKWFQKGHMFQESLYKCINTFIKLSLSAQALRIEPQTYAM